MLRIDRRCGPIEWPLFIVAMLVSRRYGHHSQCEPHSERLLSNYVVRQATL